MNDGCVDDFIPMTCARITGSARGVIKIDNTTRPESRPQAAGRAPDRLGGLALLLTAQPIEISQVVGRHKVRS